MAGILLEKTNSLFPDNRVNPRIFAVAAIISVLSCVITILLPAIPFQIFLLVLGSVLIIHYRVHVLLLILLLVTVATVLPDSFDQLTNALFTLLVFFVFLYLAASMLIAREKLQHSKYTDVLAILYLGFAINGAISSMYNSMLNQYAAAEIVRCIMYAGMLVASFHFIDNISLVKKVMWIFIVTAIALATYSYYLTVTLGPKAFVMQGITVMHGISGALANTNGTATLITYAMPIFLAYIMFGAEKRYRLMSSLIFIYILIVWIMLNSRGSYLFLFSSFIILILFHKNRWKYLSLILAGVIILFISINTIPILKLALRIQGGMTFREDLWQAAFRMIAENPILGKGFGYFDRFKFSYMDPGMGRSAMGIMYNLSTHNVLITRAVDMGIGAAIVQVVWWIIPAAYFIKHASQLRNSEYFYLYVAVGAIFIGLVIRCMFETSGTVVVLILTAMVFRVPNLIHNLDSRIELKRV